MQQVLWIGEWEKRGVAMKAKPVPLDRKPDRVWTLYGHTNPKKPPKLPFTPIHHGGAFLEDDIHDWTWRGEKFYYASRVADSPVWLLLEYKEKEMAKTLTNAEIKNEVKESLVKAFQALLARGERRPGYWNNDADDELASRLSRAYEAIYKNNTSLHGLAERTATKS